jgi:hypothetical protein
MAQAKGGDKAPKEKQQGGDKAPAAIHYEEWRMEKKIVGKEVVMEKLKKLRDCVKISDEEAEVLNEGAKSPSSINPIMYFKPGKASKEASED